MYMYITHYRSDITIYTYMGSITTFRGSSKYRCIMIIYIVHFLLFIHVYTQHITSVYNTKRWVEVSPDILHLVSIGGHSNDVAIVSNAVHIGPGWQRRGNPRVAPVIRQH